MKTTKKKEIWHDAKVALAYCVIFYPVFLILFIQNISDGKSTSNAYAFISLFLSIATIIFYVVIKQLLRVKSKLVSRLADTFILFGSSELAFFVVGGCQEFSLFGISYRLHFNASGIGPDIVKFREDMEFLFSTTCITTAILIYFGRSIFKKSISE